ncbi:MAG: sugar phosphate isomerase/epimerase family protein [Thermomicrobiales bacterium]
MKIGVSSYSFAQSFANGTMSILDALAWIADSDATHMEISIAGFATPEVASETGDGEASGNGMVLGADLINHPTLIAAITKRADERGVTLSNYAVGADFRDADLDGQIATLKKHIDVAHELGISRVRHDVVAWAWRDSNQAEFEQVFASIVPVCQEIADYAAPLGITTSIENHGFCMNNCERVRRLIYAVDRPNFKTTLDIGNFLCVDELPESAVPQNLEFASVVHLKDFYVRDFQPGEGWLKTLAGNYIQGSIVGFGDLPMKRLLSLVKQSGFDGPISIEFEGMVPDITGIETGLANSIRIWNEV